MKRYKLILGITVWMSVIFSCVSQDDLHSDNNVTPTEGKEIKVSFLSNILPEVTTRTVENITDLMILVFDENYNYISRSKAILGGVVGGQLKFEAILTSSAKNRYVHFVAGYDWTNFGEDYDLIGSDEGDIVPRLIVNESIDPAERKTCYWARIPLDGTAGHGTGITENTFKDQVIMLTRNRAKLTMSVAPTVTNFTLKGYAVYNQPDRGDIAVFKYSGGTYTFDAGTVTVPADAGQLPISGNYVTANKEIEFFEWNNNDTNSNIRMFVIFYGDYDDGLTIHNDRYYKLDFVGSGNMGEVLNIIRNTHYHFDLKLIDTPGHATAAIAASAPAGNNIFASLELQEYPSVSDGVSMMRVTQLEDIITDAAMKFTTDIYYIPDINFPTSYLPSAVTITPIADTDITYWNMTYSIQGSVVSAEIGLMPGKTIPSTIEHPMVAEYKITAGKILRILKITTRSPYQLKATTPLTENPSLNQGDQTTISFDVPATISSNLFPLNFYIEAGFLSPDLDYSSEAIQVETGGGKYRYIYEITEASKGTRVTLHFRMNKNTGTGETITLEAPPYFATETLNVSWQ